MATSLDCPHWSFPIVPANDQIGASLTCPQCGAAFAASEQEPVSAPGEQPTPPEEHIQAPPPAPFTAPESEPGNATKSSAVTAAAPAPNLAGQETCPYCCELIAADRDVCPICGAELLEEDRPWERHRFLIPQQRGVLVLVLGIVSVVTGVFGAFPAVCCPAPAMVFIGAALGCGIPAWILGQKDRAQMQKGEMDPAGLATTTSGWICGIIGTSLGGADLLVCLLINALWLVSSIIANASGPDAF